MSIKSIQSSVGKASTGKGKIILFEFGLGTDGKPTEVAVNDESLRVPYL